jgi:hypothetical protein
MKLLERGPARRFDTASAFQTALDDVVNYCEGLTIKQGG